MFRRAHLVFAHILKCVDIQDGSRLSNAVSNKLVFKLLLQPKRNSVLPRVIKGSFSTVSRVYLQRMLGYVIDKSIRNGCGSIGTVSANQNMVVLLSVYLGNHSFFGINENYY